MKYQLRPYQREAVDAGLQFLLSGENGHGLIVLPTGAGKSLVISEIIHRLNAPVLILQPSKEILEQNFAKLQSYGYHNASIYAASCGQKRMSPIVFAMIGSVYREVDKFKHFRYVVIDEAHGVGSQGSMYNDFLRRVGARCIGLTATPYRLYSCGTMEQPAYILKFLTRMHDRFFTKVIHYTQVADLLQHGFLSPIAYYPIQCINTARLKVNSTGQGYTDKSLKAEFYRSGFPAALQQVVRRLLYNAKEPRKGVLVFTQFIEEAEALVRSLPTESAIVTGKTPKKEREKILQSFKAGAIRVVANVGTLTTGFDYPELDTIVVARATRSLSLWYQIVGRAIRPHKDKAQAWVIDLCGTYDLFGPVSHLWMRDVSPVGKGLWIIESLALNKQLTNVQIAI